MQIYELAYILGAPLAFSVAFFIYYFYFNRNSKSVQFRIVVQFFAAASILAITLALSLTFFTANQILQYMMATIGVGICIYVCKRIANAITNFKRSLFPRA